MIKITPYLPPLLLVVLLVVLVVPVSAATQIIESDPLVSPHAFNRSVPGERNGGQWYTFRINNVSGYSDVTYHYTVYDAHLKDSYEYRSDAWGQWWTATPSPGKKFVFVWLVGYSEGTSWYGWGADRFTLWHDGEMIKPEPVWFSDLGRVSRGTSFSTSVPPRTIRYIENRSSYKGFTYSQDAYGYYDGLEMNRMIPGTSNAWNGYLIYQVPATFTIEKMQIAGWFGYYGTAWWNLQPPVVLQNNPIDPIDR